MNQNAQDYVKGNITQRKFTANILDEIFKKIVWKESTNCKVLDIGCGTGDVMVEILMPKLPKHFEKILGVDKSLEYIEYAHEKYSSQDGRLEFQIVNIGDVLPIKLEGQFDLVTSFFCLNWVQNYKKAFENIGKCLKQGGNIILIIVCQSIYFDILCKMATSLKWAPYITDAPNISPFHMMKDAEKECCSTLENVGFREVKCELRESVSLLDKKNFIAVVKPLDQFESSLPPHQLDDYYDEFLEEYVKNGFYEDTKHGRKYKFVFSAMICFGRKK